MMQDFLNWRGAYLSPNMATTATANQTLVTIKTDLEDVLPYLIPIFAGLAGYNWSSLIPGTNSPFLIGTAFGFLAKFLIGIQQDGWSSWEDWIPTLSISFGFLVTALGADPTYLPYSIAFGFFVKALGVVQANTASGPVEDGFLGVGALLIAWGTYRADAIGATLVSLGALLSLIGKTIPSFVAPATATPTAATPATPATAGH